MMSKLVSRSLFAVIVPVLFAAAGTARAEPAPAPDSAALADPYDGDDAQAPDDQGADPQDAPRYDSRDDQAPQAEAPPPPQAAPPPPVAQPAPPVAQQAAPAPAPMQAQAQANGQWVYTQQRGWLWMPYGEQYVYAPEGVAQPSAYVYAPAYGWTWIDAPWVWGWGPQIRFSLGGPIRFGWYHHGFARPYYRGVYRGGHYYGGHYYGRGFSGGRSFGHGWSGHSFGGHSFGGHRGHR